MVLQMLLYDHDRTEQIVSRLRNAEKIVRVVITLSTTLIIGLPALLVGLDAGGQNGAIAGGVFGAIVGYFLGSYTVVLMSAVIEWMCQLLIAQGEIVAASKRGKPADRPAA
jgi:hypothetical protein